MFNVTTPSLFELVQNVELHQLTYFELLNHKTLIEFALQEEPEFTGVRVNTLLDLLNEVESHILVTAPEDFGAQLDFVSNEQDFIFSLEDEDSALFEAPTKVEPVKPISH